jgi:hypothetical protein
MVKCLCGLAAGQGEIAESHLRPRIIVVEFGCAMCKSCSIFSIAEAAWRSAEKKQSHFAESGTNFPFAASHKSDSYRGFICRALTVGQTGEF